MSVDKVILRAFLSTFAAIVVLFAFMLSALCIFFPSTMMEITYDLGMESSSVHFAVRAYDGSEDIYYIAYATEVSIQEDMTGKILSCGEKFIHDEKFDEYCKKKGEDGESYQQFIYGQVAVSRYQKGDKTGAIELADSAFVEGRFPKQNALVVLLLTAMENGDEETLTLIGERLNQTNAEGEEGKYLEDIKRLLELD